jgi:NADH-quinone oxidoreductase subunit G
MPDIEIEIDGKKIKTQPGKMIIQVADENDIYIPRFCYHKKLSIAANCRMCLVEVEKAPKTLPACATPINDGMKVFTQSAKTLESQRAVMEFLLINHPLDCPICDQGGQCELQDFSMGYGKDHSEYHEEKRAVANDDFGPLIATQMTRCIHCTRCVRFGKEIAGVREIGMTGRGEHSQITTYVQHTVDHELSGNIIDLCPVGALLSKPFLYKARAWELTAVASIAAHDGVGSNISVQSRRGEVLRVTPRDNEAVNENWLSDRDRFSYQGLSVDRLEKPLIKDKTSGEWREVSWQTALNYVADALEKIKAVHGDNAIGALLSPNSTLEEAYLLKHLCGHWGSEQIEYRLRSASLHAALVPGLTIPITEIENQQNIILVGSHLRNDQPLLAHRVRKAALKGAKVHVIDSVRHPYAFDLASETIVKPSQLSSEIQRLLQEGRPPVAPTLVIMGEYAINHPDAAIIYTQLAEFAKKTNSHLAVLPEGANALGCHQVGAWTPAAKKNSAALKAYVLHGIEPEFDVANPQQLHCDLLSAELVVAVTPFVSDHLKKVATVLLPSAAFTETSGTFINLAGEKQSFMGCVPPKGEARPAWKIYRVLGNLLNLPDFNFESSEEILRAWINSPLTAKKMSDVVATGWSPSLTPDLSQLERITTWPDCRSDSLVRRATGLNARVAAKRLDAIHLHPETAQQWQLTAGKTVLLKQAANQAVGELVFDETIAQGTIFIAGGTALAAQLGESVGAITLELTD